MNFNFLSDLFLITWCNQHGYTLFLEGRKGTKLVNRFYTLTDICFLEYIMFKGWRKIGIKNECENITLVFSNVFEIDQCQNLNSEYSCRVSMG
ncbi:MAG: hypothetical protein CMF58_00960 [Lentimicrobiaceae bacterium]|nr:hypothetical protein [Lentimicrobiaceae bacterium]